MTQKIISLSEKTKGVIIPNTILKKLDNPDAFEIEIRDGKLILTPLIKKESKTTTPLADQSIDLYQIN